MCSEIVIVKTVAIFLFVTYFQNILRIKLKEMIREKLFNKGQMREHTFKWRCHEILRIEAFSDAVLAFAVTLTVISLEVPETLKELLHSMIGMIGFAICFTFLIMIWVQQYKFFRYFGLHDNQVIFYNAVLLFTVLFYVYPLKFLFNMLITGNEFEHNGKIIERVTSIEDMRTLMIIYGVGFIALYSIFYLLFNHVKKKKGEINLSPIELFYLESEQIQNVIFICFGIVSVVMAAILPANFVGISGIIYGLISPVLFIHFSNRGKKMKNLFQPEDIQKHIEEVKQSKRIKESEFKD